MFNIQVYLFLCFGLFQSIVVRAQDFSIPTTWRKPNSTLSRAERLTIAKAAVDSLTPNINSSNGTVPPLNTWQSANLVASIAQLDYVSASQDHRDIVKSSISAFQSGHPKFFDSQVPRNVTSDPLMWGLAAFYGSRAYNDTDLLTVAEGIWNTVQSYVVTADDAAAGKQATRNSTFTVHCIPNSDAVSTGAVFWQATTPTDFQVNGETVGAYVALSAHLWDTTRNATYLNSADQSALFMYTFMYANNQALFGDTYDLVACGITNTNALLSYNQGFIMEGLSILSTAPLSTNATWTSLLQTLVGSTIPFPAWTTADGSNAGVMNETSSVNVQDNEVGVIYKDIFINALLETWSRMSSSAPMAVYIQAFVMVQYNALLDHASVSRDGGITSYSPVWTGPAVPNLLPWGQLEAMPVLNAAVAMPPTKNSTSTAAGSSVPLSGGAIAGIVVGVIVAVVLAGLGTFFIMRRPTSRRGNRAMVIDSDAQDSSSEAMMVALTPFSPAPQNDPHLAGSSVTLESGPPAGYARKDRHGYGLTPRPLESVTQVAQSDSAHFVPSQTESSAGGTSSPTEINETSITRMIHQVLNRMQAQEAPPAYT